MSSRVASTSIEVLISKRKIAESVLAEVQSRGILGLRIAVVAKNAGVSVALVHKYFGDRDNLVAEVVGDAVESSYVDQVEYFRALGRIDDNEAFIASVIESIAKPEDNWRNAHRWLRLDAKAAGTKIPELRMRMETAITHIQSMMTDLVIGARQRCGNKSEIPASTIGWLLLSMYDGFTNNDLSNEKVRNEDYMLLIRDILMRHVF